MISAEILKNVLAVQGLNKWSRKGEDIVISSPTGDRTTRKAYLNAIASLLKANHNIQAEFKEDGRSGKIEIPTDGRKKLKIYCKEDKHATGLLLKPQFFPEITNVKIKWNNYGDVILKAIDSVPKQKLDTEQVDLLKELVRYHVNPNTEALNSLKNSWTQLSNFIPLSTINNDFAEVLGPLAVINFNLLKKDLGDLNGNNIEVFFPTAGNATLFDYLLTDTTNGKNYKISAKSGKTSSGTNTLKPKDILDLLKNDNQIKRKVYSTQMEVLRILNSNTWKQGPILALQYLKTKNFDWAKKADNFKVINEPNRQACENIMQIYSKTDKNFDFTDLFIRATQSKVYYIKFQMRSDGTPDWKYSKASAEPSVKKKKVYLRTKNYVNRPNGEKLGLQTL